MAIVNLQNFSLDIFHAEAMITSDYSYISFFEVIIYFAVWVNAL